MNVKKLFQSTEEKVMEIGKSLHKYRVALEINEQLGECLFSSIKNISILDICYEICCNSQSTKKVLSKEFISSIVSKGNPLPTLIPTGIVYFHIELQS